MIGRTFVLVALVSWGLSACSPRSGSNPDQAPPAPFAAGQTPTTTAAAVSAEDATRRFAECMREEGVDVPDLRLDARGFPILSELGGRIGAGSPAARIALAGCAPLLTQTGVLDLRADSELQAAVVAQLQAFSACMRDHGVEGFPDPSPGFAGIGPAFPPERLPREHEAFGEAVLSCQEVVEAVEPG